jgi:hypothetical protein
MTYLRLSWNQLPAIARYAELDSGQALHLFMSGRKERSNCTEATRHGEWFHADVQQPERPTNCEDWG